MKWLLISILFLSCATHKNIQAQQEEVSVKQVNGYLVVDYYDYEDCNFSDSVGCAGNVNSNKATTTRLKPKKRVVASFHSNDTTVSQSSTQSQTTKSTKPASVQAISNSQLLFYSVILFLVLVIVMVFLRKVFR